MGTGTVSYLRSMYLNPLNGIPSLKRPSNATLSTNYIFESIITMITMESKYFLLSTNTHR